MSYSAVEQYKTQTINSMTNGELLILLFDEVIKNLKIACTMLEEKNYAISEKCTQKAKEIIHYLINILDRQYPLSQELYQMYSFFNEKIISAEIKQDPKILEEITPLIEDMRQTWVEANRLTHIK
ncbi:MAG TPA: flagellar export chaperone FliS [Clostridiales bacterium]|nr:flagellar export chaperone FliS [Clostridiales bacterium]